MVLTRNASSRDGYVVDDLRERAELLAPLWCSFVIQKYAAAVPRVASLLASNLWILVILR